MRFAMYPACTSYARGNSEPRYFLSLSTSLMTSREKRSHFPFFGSTIRFMVT